MDVWDWILLGGLAAAAAAAAIYLIRRRQKGCTGCSSCPYAGSCGRKKK